MATAIQAPVCPSANIVSLESSPSTTALSTSSTVKFTFRGLGFRGRTGRYEAVSSSTCLPNRFSLRKLSLFLVQATLRPGHFAEPSVSAAVVEEYEKQLTEEEAVAEYLESVGIDTANFDELELPPSLAIVRERVEFLQKLGLTLDDINDYPLMLGYSVKRNLIPVLTYLESLGVTPKSLPILIRRYPQILHSSVVVDLQPHVEYIEGLGIARADIGGVLTRYPDLFGFKIEGTISTSTAYLVMLGVNPRRMGYILTEMPEILGMRVGNNLKRKVDFLQSFGISQSAIAKMIETRPYFLGLDLTDQMRPAVESLIELGVERNAISYVITQFPDVLSLDVKAKLGERLTFLTSDIGIRAEDMGAVIAKLPQILVINTSKAIDRVNFLRQAGLTAADVGSMVTNCPQLLAASIEKSLKPNLNYLVENMKRKLEEVVEFPAYLLFNLGEIVRPRHEETVEKGVDCSLEWMLNCPEDVFQQRLTVDYGDQKSQDEEPEVPYIVTRRARLTDEAVVPVNSEEDAEREASLERANKEEVPDAPYIVTRRIRLVDDTEDDAQSRSFS